MAASLQRGSFYEATTHTDDTLLISGRLGGGDESFCAGMRFVISDGAQTGMGEHLLAEHSSSITVLLTAATTFRHKNPVNQIVGYLMSGDPTYITSHKGARSLIMRAERDEIIEVFLEDYIENNLKED